MGSLRAKQTVCLLLAPCLLLSGCASAPAGIARPGANVLFGFFSRDDNKKSEDKKQEETPAAPYVAPPFADAVFHGDPASSEGEVRLDLSCTGDGYIGVSAVSGHRLKFQVIKDDLTYTYDLASNGSPTIFPLQSGNGEYYLRVMENIVDSKYAELYAESCQVVLKSEYAPFLRPSAYSNYTENSACVAKARELAGSAGSALDLVGKVYDYVCATVKYDRELAQNVKSGYLPDPDRTLQSGKGICFDYASLSAAMLRSQGIPTKLVFGYVAPNSVYHAWNMFYTEETGWVTVKFEVQADDWVRLDLTFAANGADADFIGDGSNYADIYYY